MYDRYNRHISYLRVSVTDRCNLRCVYCMPEEGVRLAKRSEILRFEDIAEVVETGVRMGITKVRLTGGEPLVRKGICELVSLLSGIRGVEELAMTTNGVLLSRYAHELKKAGLQRVNISLDSVSPETYKEITRGGKLEDVYAGIQAARDAGLSPIKLNVVKLNGSSPGQYDDLMRFAADEGLQLRFISQMNLKTGKFSRVEGGEGGNCVLCNRLRLTADGFIKPCLFSNQSYSIREYGIEEAFLQALKTKPLKGTSNTNGSFYNIGG